MNKFMEHMMCEARDRHREWKEKGTEEMSECPFCQLDRDARMEVSVYEPTCSKCPMLNLSDFLVVIDDCERVGADTLKRWEDYFDGDDSLW